MIAEAMSPGALMATSRPFISLALLIVPLSQSALRTSGCVAMTSPWMPMAATTCRSKPWSAALKKRAMAAPMLTSSRLLCSLLDGEHSVGDLVHRLALIESNLSRHLAMLREEELVATRREGTVIYYRIDPERVCPILAGLYSLFCADRKSH